VDISFIDHFSIKKQIPPEAPLKVPAHLHNTRPAATASILVDLTPPAA